MKNLRLGVFLFCIGLQLFLWLAPDTDFSNKIFYVNDVGETIGKKPFWEVALYFYILWLVLLFVVSRKQCFVLLLLWFIGGDFTENLYMYNLHIEAEQYPLQDLPRHLIESFHWHYLKGLDIQSQRGIYVERMLNMVIATMVFSLIGSSIVAGIKKGCAFLRRKIKA